MNVTDSNGFTGSLPSKIGLLTEITYLRLCKWKYFVGNLSCLKVSCFTNYILIVFDSHHKLLIFFSTMNATDSNNFTGSFPSEIGLLTGLTYLSLCKSKYLVHHLSCLKVYCVANNILIVFESHHK